MGAAQDLSARVSRVAIVLSLLGVIASSTFSLTAWEQGWAKVYRDGLQTESSPYAGMMKYLLIRYPDKDGLTTDFVSAIEIFLPDPASTTFRIKLQFGLMRLKNTVWITKSDPVPSHIKIMAKNLAPKRFQDNVDQIFGEHKSSLVEEYDGDRTGAKVVGAITGICLLLSAILAITVLSGCIASCCSSVPKLALKIGAWSHLIGVVVLCIVCVEFVALAIGTHRDTKDNPVVMKSYIPSPDYGWYSAVLSSLFWLCIWGAHRRDPHVLDFGSVVKDKSSLPVVGVEIPVEMSKNMKEDSAKQYQ